MYIHIDIDIGIGIGIYIYIAITQYVLHVAITVTTLLIQESSFDGVPGARNN